jgi:hypothetical protein
MPLNYSKIQEELQKGLASSQKQVQEDKRQ